MASNAEEQELYKDLLDFLASNRRDVCDAATRAILEIIHDR
jgi:hypothetical protein